MKNSQLSLEELLKPFPGYVYINVHTTNECWSFPVGELYKKSEKLRKSSVIWVIPHSYMLEISVAI